MNLKEILLLIILLSIFATLLIYDFGIKTTINSIVTLFTIYICINNIH